MVDDSELLRRYARNRSEEAFAELVRRYVDLVYSVARRQVGGDAHLAEDVVQVVFTALARKAARLVDRPVLGGWLYRTAQFAAIDAVRAERRRHAREAEAHTMNELTGNPVPENDWEKLRPAIDQVIGELNNRDRDAVVLRFFEGKSFADVGGRLRLTENAARMRVERALDKMHGLLARRGVTSTVAALGVALANQATVAAPVGLAVTVTGGALAGAGAGILALTMIFMSMTKLQVGIAGLIVVIGTTGFVLETRSNDAWRREADRLRADNQQRAALQVENVRLTQAAAEIEALRQDDAELARLREETAALKAQLQTTSHSQAATNREKSAWPNGLPIYPSSQLDRQPKLKQRVTVKYPDVFRSKPVTGQAVISLVVDANGDVRDAWAMSATHHEFEVAALEAVRKWKFDAGRKGDQAVNTRIEVPIKFTFDDQAKGIRPDDWF